MIRHLNSLQVNLSHVRLYEREREREGVLKDGWFGRWSSLYVDSAISGRLSLLLGIGAKARINSQDGEALEEARSPISSDILCCLSFFFFPSSNFRRVSSNLLREIRFADRDLVRLLSGRIAKAGRFIQHRCTKHVLYFLLLTFSYMFYI